MFKTFVEHLYSIGFYTYFLPMVLFVALSYALLKKSKILGESVALNAIISIVLGLIVFGSPYLLSIDLSKALSLFFVQIFSFLLVFFTGILVSSIFYPNILSLLEKTMKRRTTMWAMIVLGIIFFVSSGLFTVFLSGPQYTATQTTMKYDKKMGFIILLLVLLGILVVIILVASYMKVREG